MWKINLATIILRSYIINLSFQNKFIFRILNTYLYEPTTSSQNFFYPSILQKIIFHPSRVSQVVVNCVTREIRIKKKRKESVSSSSFPSSIHSLRSPLILIYSPLSRPTVNPATRGVFSWKNSRVRLLFRLGNVACALPLSPFPPLRLTGWWITVEAHVAANKWVYAGKRGANWARFFSLFFFLLFSSFPRGETVARDREKGWRSGWKAGKEREINYCHALNGCTCGLEASFFLSDAPGN